jgi:hypothetical protein
MRKSVSKQDWFTQSFQRKPMFRRLMSWRHPKPPQCPQSFAHPVSF